MIKKLLSDCKIHTTISDKTKTFSGYVYYFKFLFYFPYNIADKEKINIKFLVHRGYNSSSQVDFICDPNEWLFIESNIDHDSFIRLNLMPYLIELDS